jgi:hypothetical protein
MGVGIRWRLSNTPSLSPHRLTQLNTVLSHKTTSRRAEEIRTDGTVDLFTLASHKHTCRHQQVQNLGTQQTQSLEMAGRECNLSGQDPQDRLPAYAVGLPTTTSQKPL